MEDYYFYNYTFYLYKIKHNYCKFKFYDYCKTKRFGKKTITIAFIEQIGSIQTECKFKKRKLVRKIYTTLVLEFLWPFIDILVMYGVPSQSITDRTVGRWQQNVPCKCPKL